jgi:hypothetical protein
MIEHLAPTLTLCDVPIPAQEVLKCCLKEHAFKALFYLRNLKQEELRNKGS